MVKDAYIEALDIPDGDRELLYRFMKSDSCGINPDLCVSDIARDEAWRIYKDAILREEYYLEDGDY